MCSDDTSYGKARVDHQVVSQAVVVAIDVRADGHRDVLGLDVGDSENSAFWTGFLRSLSARGLRGVKLAIADAHPGPARRCAQCCSGPGSSVAGCISCATCRA